MIRGIGEHLLELDARRIGRLAQVVKDDLLDLDIDIRKRAVFDVVGMMLSLRSWSITAR
jgi:hypothetical protein